ncbi:hypothetical protein PGT21_016244 [Puccinia graminis f. sp. tritici]|uniref:Uncharacterized protein n=2 Tax=Puccinia graminis f. sp. tritici TaxID=56615 RepID=A0A5B0N6C5_PUCGR|nr:hypothetical protein PGT21_016244 [Puccinia graminis f. sp. tritici]KAA1093301.1 hypothetical protein PGTUg99_016070 [Puccinia graminis f. sp. tritici]
MSIDQEQKQQRPTNHPTIDHHPSIISLATPTILLVPIQPISLDTFNGIVQLFKQFSTFPLSELSSAINPTQTPPASPSLNTSSQPQLLLNFNSTYFFSPSSIYHKFLHTFQPHRKPFGIIGIVDCSHWGPSSDHHRHQPSTRPNLATSGTLNDALRSFEILLATHHPRTPVGRCFGFYPTDNQQDNVDGLVLIPHVGDQKFYLQRLITEFASDLIRSFQHLSAVLQSTSSLETPRQSYNSALFDSIPILPPLHLIPNPALRSPPDEAPAGMLHPTASSSKLAAPKARQPMDYMLNDMKLSSEPVSPRATRPDEPNHSTSVPPAINNRLLNGENRIPASFSPPPIDSRVRKRHIGRVRKVEADLELLAAKPINALKIYSEAIGHLKLASDYVWWAAALEGLAVTKMLSLLAGLVAENSVQEISDDLELAVETYSKALSRSFDGTLVHGNLESVEPLVFVESVIRLLDFKLELIELRDSQVERADGELLRMLLGNHLAQRRKSDHRKPFSLELRLDINQIGSMVELAVDGLRFAEDRIRALSKLVGVFERIGFMRKAAWFKRKLVGVVVEQIGKFRGSIPLQGRQELVKLIEEVCKSFRVPIGELSHQPVVIDFRLGRIDQAQAGWKELQLGVLMDAVIACGQLDENLSELKFRLKLNEFLDHHGSHDLEIKDDDRRINWLFKTLAHPSLKYWGPRQIVLTLELVPLSDRHALIPYHKRPILQTGIHAGTNDIPLPTFYYNHNRTPTGMGKDKALPLKMVKDEPINVLVTLQNPMSIDLEILMICLSAIGIPFEAIKTQTVVKSRTVKTIALTGVPLSSGTLKIKGCQVQLIGCDEPQEFILPIGKPKWNKKDEEELLSCEVVDGLPFLRIVSGYEELAGGGGVMVYDGEVVTIEIKIMNTSKVRADWIDVAVQDSLSDQMKKTLDDPQSSHHATYERYQLEYELVHRPVLSVTWTDSIDALGMGWVRLKCLGKAGCRSVGVRIEYDVDGGLNLKRHLEWSIGLSVQKSLNVVGFESLAGGMLIIKVQNSAQGGQVFAVEAKGGRADSQSFIKDSQKQVIQPGSTHAFLIEIEPIKVTQLDSEKSIPSLIDRQFVVTHRQDKHDDPADDGDVNDTTNKYRHNKRISKEKLAHAELLKFWIKDRLLNTITMEWREVGTNKFGEISLRGVQVDQQMVTNLRSHEVSVQLSVLNQDLHHINDKPLDELHRSSLRPQTLLEIDTFYSVLTKIKNQSGMKKKVDCLVKVMRLDGTIIPTSSHTIEDQSESLIYLIEGVVQDQDCHEFSHEHQWNQGGTRTVMLDENDEDEGHQVEMKICFLTQGAFLLQAVALDSFPHQHLDHHPHSPLGTSEVIHLVVS